MGKRRTAVCRGCGKRRGEVTSLSWEGLCLTCGIQRLEENIWGLHLHEGDALKRWRRGMAASVGAILLDDLPDGGQTPEWNAGPDQADSARP
jgi:hypothetical protein